MAKQKKSTKSEKSSTQPGAGSRYMRICFVLLLAGVVTFAWLSMLSFSPTDPPSSAMHPPKNPVDNRAGVIGAYLAYYLRYWLGVGSYMGLLFASIVAVVMVLGGRINDLSWRLVGVVCMVATTSAGAFLLRTPLPGDELNGSAGILGAGAGHFIFQQFGPAGRWIFLTVAFLISLTFVAERFVLLVPQWGKKLWERRSEIPAFIEAIRSRLPAPAITERDAVSVPASPRAIVAAPASSSGRATKAPKAEPAVKPSPKGSAGSSATAVAEPPAPPAPRLRPTPVVAPAPVQPKPVVAAPVVEKPAPKPSKPEREDKPAEKTDKAGKAAASNGQYALPSADLLAESSGGYSESQALAAEQKGALLQQTLTDFNVEAQVVGHQTGPVITLFELSLSAGVKVAQIQNLSIDIARALAVPGVRIVSPIPGKDTVGVEVPNLQKEIVRIRELMKLAPEAKKKQKMPLYLGKDAGGKGIISDLAAMPHMLIAGTTGSGKSVCINTIIVSLLMTRTPEDVRMILVDPKMVEMAAFENVPHLLCPIVNDMKKAEEILQWAAEKMDERYELLKEAGVKNIAGFNEMSKDEIHRAFGVETEEDKARIPTHIPYYVIIIDELADLIMTSTKEVEQHIIRIAQKARAVGIHLILATQRPSVNVVTGLIKANMPSRISFKVSSRQESRIVLDQNGADVLLGKGDMLFLQPGSSDLVRAQGTYLDDSEIHSVVNELRKTGQPVYNTELMKMNSRSISDGDGQRDELFDKAVEFILQSQRGSVSLLQRKLGIGYSRSSRIIDQMADAGILGDYKGSQARECLMSLEDWQVLKGKIDADQSGDSSANGEPTSS